MQNQIDNMNKNIDEQKREIQMLKNEIENKEKELLNYEEKEIDCHIINEIVEPIKKVEDIIPVFNIEQNETDVRQSLLSWIEELLKVVQDTNLSFPE